MRAPRPLGVMALVILHLYVACAEPAELPTPSEGDAPRDAEAREEDLDRDAMDEPADLEDAPAELVDVNVDLGSPDEDAGTSRDLGREGDAGCLHDMDCVDAQRCELSSGACLPCAGGSCWRSTLYPADWTPSHTDSEGRFLHDFSYAGYAAGERPIPTVAGPVFDVTLYGGGPDWGPAVRLAIEAAAAVGGGVVYFPAGEYRIDGRIEVGSSNLILRGAGTELTRVYFSTSSGMSDRAHLELGLMPSFEQDLPLRTDAERRDLQVALEDAASLEVGDEVAVGFVITPAFRAEHGMESHWGFAAGQWRAFFLRTVVAVDTTPGAHRVTLDAPLRYPVRVRDQASLRRVAGQVHEVGIEDLSLSNAVSAAAAMEQDRVSLMAFRGVKDGWLRRVRTFVSPLAGPAANTFHVQSHGVSVITSRRVTLEDLFIGRAQNRGSGGNGYLVEFSRSNEVLVQRATLRDGRHNFSFNWDFGNSGIVIRDSDSEGSTCDGAIVACRSEFHHSLAMAVLVEDTRIRDGWVGGNRRAESSGAGHTATESVYWRLHGGERIHSWQFGHGYLLGNDITEQYVTLADTTVPLWEATWYPYWALNSNGHTSLSTEPEDLVQGSGQRSALVPASLYLDQLERRTSAR